MFVLKMRTANAAFTEYGDPAPEVARLLRATADRVEAGHDEGRLRDVNGNRVGEWELTED